MYIDSWDYIGIKCPNYKVQLIKP